jgi:uncharacterized membrane protein YoaK (UPF0700 family)
MKYFANIIFSFVMYGVCIGMDLTNIINGKGIIPSLIMIAIAIFLILFLRRSVKEKLEDTVGEATKTKIK